MSSSFEETDLSGVEPISIHDRASKVGLGDLVDPAALGEDAPRVAAVLERAMPDLLGARSLRAVAGALRAARDDQREIVWFVGAHTIKCGLSLYLNALVAEGFITCLATTGSSVIHDLELAFFGATSEDVASELPAGRFGMARETSEHFNAACLHARDHGTGLGAGVGDYVVSRGAPHARVSVFAGAVGAGVPATVHVAMGTDITHQHASFPAGVAGELSMKDFRIVTHRVGRAFDRGVVVVLGSAVILPEVFLKAVSVNYNLGTKPVGVTCASFDMIQHYRVRENVLSRPFQGAGRAFTVTGHHEITLPLLYLLLRPRAA
jgi:hypothetical protein